jgi:Adenylate cyclase, family 3 (some proteins contain HAMP domain)
MTPLVTAHGGVVMRFIGGAIMAAFGVPVPRHTETEMRRDAMNAIECALARERELVRLNFHRKCARRLPISGGRGSAPLKSAF